jgi:predicted lipoprotein with Yx(FWY)xxD motif
MKANVALLIVALLSGGGLASLVGGCSGGSTHTGSVTVSANGTIYVGTKTLQTRTRRVQGTTETLYIHRGPVSAANTRHVVVKRLPHVGLVLVNGKGYALYEFVPGEHGPTICKGACAEAWPPIRLNIEMAIDSSPELEVPLVSTEPDPEHHEVGDRVVKFAGHVLHSYTGDRSPGTVNGEGVESYGGHWYLISPSGALIK